MNFYPILEKLEEPPADLQLCFNEQAAFQDHEHVRKIDLFIFYFVKIPFILFL